MLKNIVHTSQDIIQIIVFLYFLYYYIKKPRAQYTKLDKIVFPITWVVTIIGVSAQAVLWTR
jgi:hypothetical protein